MAKSKNVVQSVRITLATTPGVIAYLERLTRTHLYGKNAAETAEQLIRQEIARLVRSGELDSLAAQRPPGVSEIDR